MKTTCTDRHMKIKKHMLAHATRGTKRITRHRNDQSDPGPPRPSSPLTKRNCQNSRTENRTALNGDCGTAFRFEDCVQQLHVCTLTVPAAAQGHYAPLGMCRLTWAEPLCCKVEEHNHCCTKGAKNKDMQRRSVSPKGGGGGERRRSPGQGVKMALADGRARRGTRRAWQASAQRAGGEGMGTHIVIAQQVVDRRL